MKTQITVFMLSKEKCIEAIMNWDIARPSYSKIEKLFPASSCFIFNKEGCDWINEKNQYDSFHTYIGIHENQLILIVVPLNASGGEVQLSSYLTSTLRPLTEELVLVETDIVTTTKKTTLSVELNIIDYCEEVDASIYNEPTLLERASVADIQKWKNDFLNWFYCECTDFNGERIFKTFTVPFSDLIKDDSDYDEVIAVFGFKDSTVYQREIPVLIFIAVDSQTQNAQVIRSSSVSNLKSYTNTKDYSQPCPPMCRLEKSFNLIG